MQGVRRFRLVFSNGRLTFLEIDLQSFFFFQQIAQRILTKRSAPLDRIADVLAADRFGEALCHSWIAVGYVQINQARAASNYRLYHARSCTTQRFFEWGKSCDSNGIIDFVRRGRCDRLRRRFGCVTTRDILTEKRAATIFGQAFGADDPGKEGLVHEVLLDCVHCFLAGQKH